MAQEHLPGHLVLHRGLALALLAGQTNDLLGSLQALDDVNGRRPLSDLGQFAYVDGNRAPWLVEAFLLDLAV